MTKSIINGCSLGFASLNKGFGYPRWVVYWAKSVGANSIRSFFLNIGTHEGMRWKSCDWHRLSNSFVAQSNGAIMGNVDVVGWSCASSSQQSKAGKCDELVWGVFHDQLSDYVGRPNSSRPKNFKEPSTQQLRVGGKAKRSGTLGARLAATAHTCGPSRTSGTEGNPAIVIPLLGNGRPEALRPRLSSGCASDLVTIVANSYRSSTARPIDGSSARQRYSAVTATVV